MGPAHAAAQTTCSVCSRVCSACVRVGLRLSGAATPRQAMPASSGAPSAADVAYVNRASGGGSVGNPLPIERGGGAASTVKQPNPSTQTRLNRPTNIA